MDNHSQQTDCLKNVHTAHDDADKLIHFLDNKSEQLLYIELSTFWYCFLALITTLGLIISLVSNLIIIYLFTSTPAFRKNPSNIIAVNLSLSDMLYCIQWPSVIYCCLTQSTWILEYEFVCKSLGFITVSTALVSIMTVLVMSLERAIVVKYSVLAKNWLTIDLAWLIIMLIWFICIISCIPPLFGKLNRYTLDPSKTSCTLDYLSTHSNYKLYILILYICFYIIPIITIFVSYSIILSTFNESSLSLKEVRSSSSASSLLFAQNNSTSTTRQQANNKFSSSLMSHKKPATQLKRLNSDGSLLDKMRWSFKGPISIKAEKRVAAANHGESKVNDNEPESASYEMMSGANLNKNDQTNKGNIIKPETTNLELETIYSRLIMASTVNINETNKQQTGVYVADKSTDNNTAANSFGILKKKRSSTSTSTSIIQSTSNSSKPNSMVHYNKYLQSSRLQSKNRNALQLRLAKMSFYLILLWLVSWSPIAWLAMLNSILKCHRASATAVFLASTMTKLGPAFDVFIYGLSHPKLKSKFRLIINRLLMFNNNNNNR